jgi:hypothetical protein
MPSDHAHPPKERLEDVITEEAEEYLELGVKQVGLGDEEDSVLDHCLEVAVELVRNEVGAVFEVDCAKKEAELDEIAGLFGKVEAGVDEGLEEGIEKCTEETQRLEFGKLAGIKVLGGDAANFDNGKEELDRARDVLRVGRIEQSMYRYLRPIISRDAL